MLRPCGQRRRYPTEVYWTQRTFFSFKKIDFLITTTRRPRSLLFFFLANDNRLDKKTGVSRGTENRRHPGVRRGRGWKRSIPGLGFQYFANSCGGRRTPLAPRHLRSLRGRGRELSSALMRYCTQTATTKSVFSLVRVMRVLIHTCMHT